MKAPSHSLASNELVFLEKHLASFPKQFPNNVLRIISPIISQVIFNKAISQKLNLKYDEIVSWEVLDLRSLTRCSPSSVPRSMAI